mmetsp:Transcript_23005/g.40494  ORF Transcript_23005/g.40494 Transcript_23005/m.40494 type:complete len:82 (+) Transcript_23005:384-629(+)|eukprot:CAMPEP_0178874332 /NCGR_PEP_ID=MMETSP0747-20121128/9157_1 /TAXON_ID=913974 /ORGANISM="Nitzschia punctata, Strain CCMP561" /LENGTH=81 /DNA_ID=CAMNT_0020541719 /DNA_START=355 /DNA_END=600 /DNA_ORIENTATION=+
MPDKEQYHSGLDLKSLALNFASALLFVLPLAMYFYPEFIQKEIAVVVMSFVVAVLVPPMGWMRPHPYSDMPGNLPYPRKKE